MAKTKHDLAKRVLQELRILAGTEDPTAHDAAFVQDEYAGALLELAYADTAAWPEDAIPDAAFLPMARYLAVRLAGPFGVEYALPLAQAELMLRRVTGKPATGEPAQLNTY